ncbi:hypothetical protein D3C85_434250 [compost metagenome]
MTDLMMPNPGSPSVCVAHRDRVPRLALELVCHALLRRGVGVGVGVERRRFLEARPPVSAELEQLHFARQFQHLEE